ncbi:MAG: RNA polymerase sigma factor, partial [Actinomycetota bacterium]
MSIAVSAKELHNLISAAKRSDPDAWALLVRRGYRRMLAYSRRRLSGESAVAAVEQTFERACERIRDLRDTSSFDAWMFALLRSVIVELQRSRRAGRRESQERGDEPSPQANGDLDGVR